MEQTFFVVSFLLASMLFGAMLFFSFLVAPITFIKLDPTAAGQLIRSIFPHYYLMIILLSLITAILLAMAGHSSALLMFIIGISGVFSRQSLIPRINNYRDAEIAGDASAKSKFDRLHRLSVVINGVQIIFLILSILIIYSTGLGHTN